LEMDKTKPFPCISRLFITLMERPKVDFNVEFLTNLDIDLLPGLKDWICKVIEDSVAKMLVFPGRIYLNFKDEGIETVIIPRNPLLAIGVLVVDVELYLLNATTGTGTTDVQIKIKTHAQERECAVFLSNDSSRTVKMFHVFVYDYDDVLKVSVQKLAHMQAFSSQIMSTSKYASTEIILLEAFRDATIERTLENRAKNIGLRVTAKIEPLPMVPVQQNNMDIADLRLDVGEESAMGGSMLRPGPINGSPSGVLQIHIHYANNMISEDYNGKSDPYAKIFINGDLAHKTKMIPKTLNPVFNDIFELTTNDITSILDIKVECYDADDIGTDDFLGFCNVDIPTLNAYSINKRYELIRRPAEGAGTINISVVFREVALTRERISANILDSFNESPSSKRVRSSSASDNRNSKKTSLKKRLFRSQSKQ